MKLLKNISVIFICFFFPLKDNGQQILFRSYSVAEGLPSSTVRAITQDAQGYMWFGTKNGLSRFDGYNFKTFQFNKKDTNSLGNNFVHCITRYDSTHLWIGTENGVYILNLEKGKFTHFKGLDAKTVFDILKDKSGKVWIASRLNGLYCYDPVKKTTQSFRFNNTSFSVSGNQITKLAEDNDGNIWIGTFGFGIDVYNPASKMFTNIPSGKSGLSNGFINSIYKGYDGTMWVGTMNGGLCRWNAEQHTFKTYTSSQPYSIKDNIVRAIYQTDPTKLYVGTEKGLNVLDLANDKFVDYVNESSDPFSISDNAIYSIFSDRNGTIWVGTFFGGVSYFNEKGSVFELYYPTGEKNSLAGRAVSCFLEDTPGNFWIGTEDGGLQYFNNVAKTFKKYPFLPNQQKLSYHNIHSLIRDKKGNIWIGVFAGGINIYNPSNGQIKYFKQQPGDNGSLNSNNVFSIYEDREGIIWIGTDKGLNCYNENDNTLSTILKEGIDNTIIYDVYEDNNRTLWFATYNNGLIWFNKKTQEWKTIGADDTAGSLTSNKLTCLLDDHAGNLWIGTDGGGLNKMSFKTKQVNSYGTNIGITGNVIYGIQEDNDSTIWVTTNNGIYNFDPHSNKVKHYTKQDNLQSQQFNYKAFYKAADGKMFAGGVKGFNAFYPERLSTANAITKIAFTNFQLFNKSVLPSDKESVLKNEINYTDKISLEYDQSVISFEFAALNFNAPEKVRYAYKMQGFDPDWNYVSDQRKATYTNLSPGHYVFKVKATTDESTWDVPESSIVLVVKPPFYRTNIAYILYVLLLLSISYALYKYSVNYVRKKNQIKLERLKSKEEQEFYTRKIEFFTVMAHEIRTPLSLIIAPLEKLLTSKKWDTEEKVQLQIMDENAGRLMNLVNQLLDFRRIESDVYQIKNEPVELVSLVQSIYSRFSSMTFDKNIEFSMSTKISQLLIQADPEVLTKIISNLLINAFKFARKKVGITIHDITREPEDQQQILISVEDDGIGIPKHDIANIFKKFFTTTSGDQQYHNLGGSGIGLALASVLAGRISGTILVESKEGHSTIFTLSIPYLHEKQEVETEKELNSETSVTDDEHLPLILLVEDDKPIQSFIANSLLTDGYRVQKAGNGKQALQLVENSEFDLIISDIMMPVMDGMELCKALKTNIHYSHIPFVVLTARGNSEAEIQGIENGADAYILKPFKWKHVSAIIRNLLESRERLKLKFSEQPYSEVSVLTTNSRDKEFMEKIVGIIESRIIDPQLSVEELSKEMTMSRSSLHKKLKSLSGFVPNELIKLIRLKQGAKLLQTGEHSIAEVAYMSGFSSSSYFSKCFLQQFKVSPKEYADSLMKDASHDLGNFLN
jgi:ligand-binding sensor domain-containing protein/signal transduction histidine kinase/DNA-binding response OmpR family regulator